MAKDLPPHVEAADAPYCNTVTVTASGLVGSGKSAILGEIEIALKAIGVPVSYADARAADAEKSMTHADWQEALDLYRPRVVLVERNWSGCLPDEVEAALVDVGILRAEVDAAKADLATLIQAATEAADQDTRACEQCSKPVDVENLVPHGDVYVCVDCDAEWREVFLSCIHVWDTEKMFDVWDNEGRMCYRCNALVSHDSAMNLFPLICDGWVEEARL